jgi:hypothetical protein
MRGTKFWLFVIIFTLLSAMTFWQVHNLGNQIAFSDQKVGALSSALTKEQRNAERKGVTPVAPPAAVIVKDPSIVAGPPGPTGPAGPQGQPGVGPTDAQVINATFMVLRSNPTLTVPQIKTQVAEYLTANPPASGINGQNGLNGASGHNGAPGVSGTNGANGKNGVGIQSVTWNGCNATIMLTDGTTSTSGSLCGPKGDIGPTGPIGPTGQPATPFTFTFIVPGPDFNSPLKNSTSYTCTITAPDTTATCKQN